MFLFKPNIKFLEFRLLTVALFGFQWTEMFIECTKMDYAPLAQLVEQLTLNQWVPGSNP